MEEIEIYSTGMCFLSACVKKGLEKNYITDQINAMSPTGISSSWSISEQNFGDGSGNPHQCEKHSDREHYLFVC